MICRAGAQPELCFLTQRFSGLPEGLDGCRVLFLTDLHYGRWFGEAPLKRLLDTLCALPADLILIGGDLADHEADAGAVVARLSRLQAPMGVFCVPGNNDFEAFGGDYAAMAQKLDAAGVRLLVNCRVERAVAGGRLLISGLDEPKYGQPDAGVLRVPRQLGDFHVLLTHSPWALGPLLGDGDVRVDLALCGHTHGGQCALGGLSPYRLGYERGVRGSMPLALVRGEQCLAGTRVLVSCGIGMSTLPVRIGANPQIHEITLRRA